MNAQPISDHLFSNSRLILSAGTLTNTTFVERVSAAQEAGFNAISMFPQQYLGARRREHLSISDMQGILVGHEVALEEVDPLLDWFGSDATPSETLMMEMAEALGARSINVAAAFVSDRPFQALVDCYGRLCERVAQHGLRANLEFLPWTAVDSLTSALEIVDAVAQPNAGVMLDFWHFFHSGEDLDVLRQLTPLHAAHITGLQLNDVPESIDDFSRAQSWVYTKDMFQNTIDSIRVMGMDAFLKVAIKAKYPHPAANKMMKDAQCSRLFPGEGVMPVAEVLAILSEKGVAPAIGIEVFNLEHNALKPAAIAMSAMKAYEAVARA